MDARNKVRHEEIKAINETIDILTADDTRDLANKTMVKTMFLQEKISREQGQILKNRAVKVLQKAAIKTKNPELSMIASQVQLDAFTKVLVAFLWL